MKSWICVGLEGYMFWPDKEAEIDFDGHRLLMRPETKELAPSIAFEIDPKRMTYEEAMHLIQRFISALSWVENVGIRAFMWSGGSHPVKIGKHVDVRHVAPRFDKAYLPNPVDEKQRLALALYRDALSLNSVAYKFLGLARILNIKGKAKVQKEWINNNLLKLKNPDSLGIVEKLKLEGVSDIGHYLYHFGRSSVAHAEDDVVNPDLATDERRLNEEMPLIQEFAEIFIESELGIKSQRSIYLEHLYELSGFKKKLDGKLIKEALDGINRKIERSEVNFSIKIGLRQKTEYYALRSLEVVEAALYKGSLQMSLYSPDKRILVWLGLNFQKERIVFWPIDGIRIFDDGTREAALLCQSIYEFKRDLFLNGSLEILDEKTGEVLGYSDPFVASNIDLTATVKNFDKVIEECKKEVGERS